MVAAQQQIFSWFWADFSSPGVCKEIKTGIFELLNANRAALPSPNADVLPLLLCCWQHSLFSSSNMSALAFICYILRPGTRLQVHMFTAEEHEAAPCWLTL